MRRSARWSSAVVLVGGAVLAASAESARRGLPAWEARLYRRVRDTPGALTAALFAPMQLGAAAAPPVVAVVAWRAGLPRRSVWGVAVTGLAAWWAGKGIKRLVGRARPHALVPGTTVAVGGSRDGLGFVSGHAAVAAATALVLTPVLPRRWRLGASLLAATVGVARVQNGSHLPLDVLGGAGLGMALGGAWLLVEAG